MMVTSLLNSRGNNSQLEFALPRLNQSQGQSLDLVGVDLRISSFSYGQLHVALCRVTDVSKLALLFKEDAPQKTEDNIQRSYCPTNTPTIGLTVLRITSFLATLDTSCI